MSKVDLFTAKDYENMNLEYPKDYADVLYPDKYELIYKYEQLKFNYGWEKDINKEYKEKFSIIIDCDSELHQEEIFYNLTNQGLKCRVQSL